MKRLLPAPLLSVALFLLWLLLNRSLGAGHLVLALALAIAIPVLLGALRPLPVRIRKPGTVLRLMLRVMQDAVRANFTVARVLLGLPGPRQRRHAPGFVHVPLELRDPNGLAALAMIVCITPGTAWAELSLDRATLLLHVLEVDDAGALAAHIKTRYERLLMEIFE